jgi:hypothetical protein
VLGFVSPTLVIVYLIGYAITGMAIGAVSGWLASMGTKCRPRSVWIDGLLGLVGFLTGLFGTIFTPWHVNTITEKLDGGGTVSTTMNRYQHPERIAVVVAIVLPLIYELYRFWRARPRP